jgi:hypothetical protein
MLSEDPLEVPEIAGLVASYLKGKYLARCVQVSKGWRDRFLPYRWRTIKAGAKLNDYSHKSSRRRLGPHPRDVYSHRHLIHDLWIIGKTTGLDKHHFPNLRKLRLEMDKVPPELAKIFPSMVKLHLDGPFVASNSWSALVAHPSITELTLLDQVIRVTNAPSFWEVCRRLDVLVLSNITFGDGVIPALAGTVFDRLRRLEIEDQRGQDISYKLELILRCPNLKELRWIELVYIYNSPIPNTELIREGHWHRLQELTVQHTFRDMQVASILKGIGVGSLARLTLKDCWLEEQGSKATCHFATLAYLNIEHCCYVSSSGILDILCSCPRLEIFYAASVSARDVVNGGPWVCQRLRELRIGFLFRESDQDLQREIFGRLSTLTRLESLVIHIPDIGHYGSEDILEFRLENGMGQLATLKQLTSLGFERSRNGTYASQMGQDEVLWMLANWKKLKSIAGKLSDDPEEDRRLKLVLWYLGVKTAFPNG